VISRRKQFTALVLCLAVLSGACSAGETADRSRASFDDAVERLGEMGTLRYLIAAPSNGECKVLASQDDEMLLPLASVFKLYVLGALVDAVRSGGISWDGPIQIRDEFDSLGGPTASEEAGTEFPVRELAQRMITVSDNTATDHLIAFVGREAVERIQSLMGHSQPEVNVPLPTTRELAILKYSGDTALAESYVAAGSAGRRAILDEEVASRPFPAPEQIGGVFGYQDTMGWFGTAGDVCRALEWSMRDDEARAILTDSPLSPNRDLWPELGFKGGSDDGVATAAWWMQAGDGRVFVAIVSLVNDTSDLDMGLVIDQMVLVRDGALALSPE